MKITIARIRSNVKYNGPLETVLDSFFENYVKWMKANPQHEYDTYNVSFGKDRPKRTPETIEWADVIVIPSDSEFRYHGELQMNPKDLDKSEKHMETIRPYFEDKKVIMWRSDRGDTEELYRTETLKGVNLKSFHTIDEIDFSGNIHGMKYHFIQTLKNPLADLMGTEKTVDFAYWGRMKHGHDREKTIRQIYRDKDMSTVLVGGFPSVPHWCEKFRESKIRKNPHFVRGHVSVFSSTRIKKIAKNNRLQLEFISGAYFMRSSGFFLEDYAWWLRINLLFGALFPSWPGEIYWIMRKSSK